MTDPIQPTQPTPQPTPLPTADPYSQLTPPTSAPTRSRGKRILIGGASILVGILVFVGVRVALSAINSGVSSDEIASTVEQLKEQNPLPQQIDEVTTLDDITAEESAIHYHYTLAGLEPSAVSADVLETIVLPGLCSTSETKSLLDHDVRMKYSYTVSETGDEYNLDFGKADC